MRPVACFALSLCLVAAPTAAATPEATFLGDSVYTAPSDCAKHKKVTAGGPRSSLTVPNTLTAKGYVSFDGACRFVNIDERYKGRIWTVSLSCKGALPEATLRSEVWRRLPDGSLSITVGTLATTLVACGPDKPAAVKAR